MRYHERFDWGLAKAKANLTKHKVSFDEAAAVLEDDPAEIYHLEEFDDAYSEAEDRHITIGSHPQNRDVVLVICWTLLVDEELRSTRVISARRASPAERRKYAQYVKDNSRR